MATSRKLQAALAALSYVVEKNEGIVCSIGHIYRRRSKELNTPSKKVSKKNTMKITVLYTVSIDKKNRDSEDTEKYSSQVTLFRENQRWVILNEDEFVESEN